MNGTKSFRCIPQGALPYENIKSATHMIAKLFPDIPYLPLLPNIAPNQSLKKRTLKNMPGIIIGENDEINIDTNVTDIKSIQNHLNKVMKSDSIEDFKSFEIDDIFFEKFLLLIKKFKSSYACINLLGPFSVSRLFTELSSHRIFINVNVKKLYLQTIVATAAYAILKIKEYNPDTTPIIIFEEPTLAMLGMIKHDNEAITVDLVIDLLASVFSKIKERGALVCVKCLGKCDWSIPIKAGADIISYDAYNNPNNLCIIPDVITDYLNAGGKINWGIIPVISENMIMRLNNHYVYDRLKATIDGVSVSGVPSDLLYRSASISINGDVNNLPLIFAEKVAMLTKNVSSRLTVSG